MDNVLSVQKRLSYGVVLYARPVSTAHRLLSRRLASHPTHQRIRSQLLLPDRLVQLLNNHFLGLDDLLVLLALHLEQVPLLGNPFKLFLEHVVCMLQQALRLFVLLAQHVPLIS